MNEQDQNAQEPTDATPTETIPAPADGQTAAAVQTTDEVPADTASADAAAPETAVDTAVERHPAHSVLDRLENDINSLGSYAVSVLMKYVEEVRSLI